MTHEFFSGLKIALQNHNPNFNLNNFITNNPLILLAIPTQFEPLLQSVSWEAVYLVATAIIGLLIAYESVLLKKNAGKLPDSMLFNISSILETLWFMVSAVILYFANFSTLPKSVAVAYILYGIGGWIYSFYLLKDQDIDIDELDEVAMPAKYMDYSLSFSAVILPTCLAFLGFLYSQGKFAFIN